LLPKNPDEKHTEGREELVQGATPLYPTIKGYFYTNLVGTLTPLRASRRRRHPAILLLRTRTRPTTVNATLQRKTRIQIPRRNNLIAKTILRSLRRYGKP
jgi:hypothetical protein